ncbi:hypothetical protein ACFJIS_18895 [Variovorax boronicumulans]|uniref:hypothetical protein n=1 Tax=Variovorax boronicumulans TaxID=436515 RepID=UPI0036F3E213
MNGAGMFFLTARPSLVHMTSPEQGDVTGWQFTLLERTKRGGTQALVAYWKGTEGALFVQAHAKRLVRGCALNLELERLRPHRSGDGLEGYITACSLAPERWPGYHVEPRIDPPHQPRPLAA